MSQHGNEGVSQSQVQRVGPWRSPQQILELLLHKEVAVLLSLGGGDIGEEGLVPARYPGGPTQGRTAPPAACCQWLPAPRQCCPLG